MTKDEVQKLAEEHVARMDMKGLVAKVFRIVRGDEPHQWLVIFELFNPGGGVLDTGFMLIVDETTGEITDASGP